MDVLEILISYTPFFKIANVISDLFRWILWALVSVLAHLSDGIESIVNKIYSLNYFFNKSEVQLIVDKFKPVLWVVLTLSILYIGYKLVIDREFKGERIFQNFLLAFMVILALPAFMVQMNEITTRGVKAVHQEIKVEENTTTARSIIKDNIYDLKYLENQKFKIEGNINDSSTKTNNINPKNILKININSTIDRGSLDKKVFKQKIELDENGEEKVVDLDKSFFGFIEEQYYRYNFNFLTMIIMLICLILTFVLTSIKIARIIIELAFKKVFAMMLAFGDISSGQRLKTVLKDILSSFGIIFATAILLKLYMISTTWINTLPNLNIFVKIIFIIASSLMVIDGPNIIERVLGIDAGIKSGWSLVAGAYTGAKTMSSIGSKLGGTLSNTISAVGGGAKGVYDGFNSSTLEEESKSAKGDNSNNSDSKTNSNENNSANNSNSNNLNSNETGKTLSEENQDLQGNNNLSSNETSDNNLSSATSSEDSLNENSNNISSEYGEATSLSDDMDNNVSSSYGEQETLTGDINETTKDNTNTSLESESKDSDISSNTSSIEDNVTNNPSDSLSSDISKNSEPGAMSDVDQGQKTLDSDIKSDNNLNSSPTNKKENKPVGNNETLKTENADKDVVKNSEKLETRGVGQYTKDSLSNKVQSSKPVQNAKKHYNLGVNTGKNFRNYIDKKNGKGNK